MFDHCSCVEQSPRVGQTRDATSVDTHHKGLVDDLPTFFHNARNKHLRKTRSDPEASTPPRAQLRPHACARTCRARAGKEGAPGDRGEIEETPTQVPRQDTRSHPSSFKHAVVVCRVVERDRTGPASGAGVPRASELDRTERDMATSVASISTRTRPGSTPVVVASGSWEGSQLGGVMRWAAHHAVAFMQASVTERPWRRTTRTRAGP